MTSFILNDKAIETDLPPGMVVLDFIRYNQHLTGTKIGCREGDCGACTILVGKIPDGHDNSKAIEYQAMTSCLMPLANANGKHIVTIEGINLPGKLNPIQQAMAEEGATQCGFCTPGFVMSLAGHCLNGNENVIESIDGNICRCTGYKSIERAARKLQLILDEKKEQDTISFVTSREILPMYLSTIKQRLLSMFPASSGTQLQTTDYKPQTILAGGTDLYVQKHEQMVHASSRFVFDDPLLNEVKLLEDTCEIGASATVSDLKNSIPFNKAFPSFQRYVKLVSSTPIRNMATIAGNFVNASPIGDMTVFFLVLNTTLELSSLQSLNGNGRQVKLSQFYKGYKQLDKVPEEMIEQIRFDLPQTDSYFNFEKVSKRMHLDIASVNSAIHIKMNADIIVSAIISAGGVGPIPMVLGKTSAFLNGKSVTSDLIADAIEVMKTEISPISDARGSKEYKTLLLGQLIRAHLLPLLSV